jgi:hypothetical protein
MNDEVQPTNKSVEDSSRNAPDETTSDAASILADLDLVNVLVESFSARARRIDEVKALQLGISYSYHKGENGILLYKFVTRCDVLDTPPTAKEGALEEHQLALLRCTVVCEYGPRVEGAASLETIPDKLLEDFSQEMALKDAFPYIREALSSMSSRLGYPKLTLGAYKPGADISFTVPASFT